MTYLYKLYGLQVQSVLCIPNAEVYVSSRESTELVDVKITWGLVGMEGLDNPLVTTSCYQASANEFWMTIPTLARFSVQNGNTILIDKMPGVDEDSLRVFLMAVCFQVLLTQRKYLVLNGYALKQGNTGFAVLGWQGLAYYMLMAEFIKRKNALWGGSYFILDKQGRALAGAAQIDVSAQVVSYLGLDISGLKTLRPGMNKYPIPLEQQNVLGALKLERIYLLKTHQQADIRVCPVEDEEKANTLQAYLKTNLLYGLPETEGILADYEKTLNSIQLITIFLPVTGLKLRVLADSIENDVTMRGVNHAVI